MAFSWVNDAGALVVSDQELELAFKYYRGGGMSYSFSLLFLH